MPRWRAPQFAITTRPKRGFQPDHHGREDQESRYGRGNAPVEKARSRPPAALSAVRGVCFSFMSVPAIRARSGLRPSYKRGHRSFSHSFFAKSRVTPRTTFRTVVAEAGTKLPNDGGAVVILRRGSCMRAAFFGAGLGCYGIRPARAKPRRRICRGRSPILLFSSGADIWRNGAFAARRLLWCYQATYQRRAGLQAVAKPAGSIRYRSGNPENHRPPGGWARACPAGAGTGPGFEGERHLPGCDVQDHRLTPRNARATACAPPILGARAV